MFNPAKTRVSRNIGTTYKLDFLLVLFANSISLDLSGVKVYLFYLHEHIGPDIHNHKATLCGGPHHPTYFIHSENGNHLDGK